MQDTVKLTVRVVFMRMGLHSLTYLNIWSFIGGIRRCGLVEGGVSTRGKLWCFNRFVPFPVSESLSLPPACVSGCELLDAPADMPLLHHQGF